MFQFLSQKIIETIDAKFHVGIGARQIWFDSHLFTFTKEHIDHRYQ